MVEREHTVVQLGQRERKWKMQRESGERVCEIERVEERAWETERVERSY